MSQTPMDWDEVYQRGPVPPWSIGRPQPELAELIAEGKVHGAVLDAGCGHAELALALAAQGYTVVGLDVSATAVAAARATAAERGLGSVTFAQADVTDFGGYDGQFSTIMDSGLFHALPVEKRAGYLRCIAGAAAADAVLYILSFAAPVGGATAGSGPRGVTEEEFRQAVSAYWVVDEIRPAYLYGNATASGGTPNLDRVVDGDSMKMRGFLLGAHKPGGPGPSHA
jgi:SAM-dependent methyltransferase